MVNGVRHCRSTETGNRKRAEAVERDFKDELRLKQSAPKLAPEMTFGELSAKFLASSSFKPYHFDRLKFLLPFFEQLALKEIGKNVASDYQAYRHKARKLNSTINRDLEVLRHMLFWAVDEGVLLRNANGTIGARALDRSPTLMGLCRWFLSGAIEDARVAIHCTMTAVSSL